MVETWHFTAPIQKEPPSTDAAPITAVSNMDVVAILVNYRVKGEIGELPLSTEMVEVIHYCWKRRLVLILGCDANSSHTMYRFDISPKGRILLVE
jgi:hypothetical protein